MKDLLEHIHAGARAPAVLVRRAGVGRVLILLIAGLLLWAVSWRSSASALLVLDDNKAYPVRTHQSRVGGLLREVGLSLHSADIVIPPPTARLTDNTTVILRRARPYILEADGTIVQTYSHALQVDMLLAEAGIALNPQDAVLVEGHPVSPDAPIPNRAVSTAQNPFGTPAPLQITVRRGKPFVLHDGAASSELYSTTPTVGQALSERGIILYAGDEVSPDLGSPLTAGLHIFIRRSKPVEILADGRHLRTRTQADNVGDLLTQLGIALVGMDRVEPSESAPVVDNLAITITRVREETVIEEEALPFETLWEPDPELEIDQQRLQQAGAEGLLRRRWRIHYEDGQEAARILEDEWVDREPTTQVYNYGTKIVIRELETPDGTIQYWRHIRMLATSYTAATSGKEPDHPQYGITFLGWQMRHGIVAVDPSVIPLRTQVYVPGYGKGVAGDTGGAIKGRHIDLGYDEGNVAHWYKWVDVYLLAPPPPASQIRWVLPNWPRESR